MYAKETEELTKRIAAIAQIASILEASADKPGNVSPWHDFSDTKYEDFLAGSVAIGGIMGIAADRGILAGDEKISLRDIKIGELIRDCAFDVKNSHYGGNTHLGIILLMVPIAAAYGYSQKEDIGKTIKKILKSATVEDTLAFYDAVKISNVNIGSKLKKPKVPFYEMLCTSAINDRIAEDLVSGLRITTFLSRTIEKNVFDIGYVKGAIVQSYLELLAAYPDTLIAKKCGREKSEEVSARAQEIVELEGIKTKEGRKAIEKFGKELQGKKNQLNPGTTADLIAAGLMLYCLRNLKPFLKNRV